MSIFVIGAIGFVGGDLTWRLIAEGGHTVTGLARTEASADHGVRSMVIRPGLVRGPGAPRRQ
ncbi:hypothetical protein ACFWM7_17455 [Streptomyces sp. NPDC058375]|uniref:hypothetical protein n=1 Tax=Streptomyces sp. NPDC058375 TaxID=3346467 RepID=UPI003660B1C4